MKLPTRDVRRLALAMACEAIPSLWVNMEAEPKVKSACLYYLEREATDEEVDEVWAQMKIELGRGHALLMKRWRRVESKRRSTR